jgi:hypothetical protein
MKCTGKEEVEGKTSLCRQALAGSRRYLEKQGHLGSITSENQVYTV